MAVSKEYLAFIQEQLSPLLPVQPRRMFSSIGLYSEELFFAIISDDTLYFKVDDRNRPDYEAAQMWAFAPFGGEKRSMSYYAVPADVLEDRDELRSWVLKAVDAAQRNRKPPARKKNIQRPPTTDH